MSDDLVTYVVDCKRSGELLASYAFSQVETAAGPPPPPSRESLEKDAKENLSQEGLAFPPYDGITFHIRRR